MALAVRDGAGTSYCRSSTTQTLLIKAAQKTNYFCSALIYMQLKFHVCSDQAGGRQGDSGEGIKGETRHWRQKAAEKWRGEKMKLGDRKRKSVFVR